MPSHPNSHVLVVEDDRDFAALVTGSLRRHGYSATAAHDGEAALDAVQARRPDLITLDLLLSRRTGAFFFRQLKTTDALRDIPVVVITGLTARDGEPRTPIVHARLQAGALPPPDAYLEKPVAPRTLIRTIERLLGDRQPSASTEVA